MLKKSTLSSVVGETQVMECTGNRKVKDVRVNTIGIEDLVALTDGMENLIRVFTKSFGSKSNGVWKVKTRWKSR